MVGYKRTSLYQKSMRIVSVVPRVSERKFRCKMSLELQIARNDVVEKAPYAQLTVYAIVWILNNFEEAKGNVIIGQNAGSITSNLHQMQLLEDALRMYYRSLQSIETTIQLRLNTTQYAHNWRTENSVNVPSYNIVSQLMIWLMDSHKAYE